MVAILRLNQRGIVVDANHAATDLLGATVGRRCCDVVLARSSNRHLICRPDCAAKLRDDGSCQDRRGAVVRGRSTRMICAAVGEERLVILLDQGDDAVSNLSPRECAVLALIAAGRSDAEAAHELCVQPSTVKTHVARARQKLGARTRAEAVALAIRSGLIA